MRTKLALRAALAAACLTAAVAPPGAAQARRGLAPTDELYKTVAGLDVGLFGAYNTCDLEKFGSYVADDIEFYHDNGGVTLGREPFVKSVKDNVCGRTRRELVPGTLEVYPMKGIGAIEYGVHRFYDTKSATPDKPVGEAQFSMLWRFENGAWKITRAFSYDHHPLP